MNSVSWPVVVLLGLVITALVVLGVTHVLDTTWLERTLSAILGFIAGNVLGAKGVNLPRMMRKE